MLSFLTRWPCLTGPLCATASLVLAGSICAIWDKWRRGGLKARCRPRRASRLAPRASTPRSVVRLRPQVGESALSSSCGCVYRRPLPSAWPTAPSAGRSPVGCVCGAHWELRSF